MPEVREGRLTFHFPEGWQSIKYDDSNWHRQRMKSRLKAMDILAHQGGPTHWWIEVKDCEGYEPENHPRLSGTDPAEVSQVREWVKQQGLESAVQMARRKPFIIDEIEEKLRDTLAAITVAQREADTELAEFIVVQTPSPVLRVVLLLTWDQRDFKRLAIRLKTKLERALSPYGIQGFVVNEYNTADAGLHCEVTRSEA